MVGGTFGKRLDVRAGWTTSDVSEEISFAESCIEPFLNSWLKLRFFAAERFVAGKKTNVQLWEMKQEKPTNRGTKATDAPDKLFSRQTLSESTDYLDCVHHVVRS